MLVYRNAIGAARLGGLEDELGLKGYQFQVTPILNICSPGLTLNQTAVTILFVGYILMQVPSNLFLNKIG